MSQFGIQMYTLRETMKTPEDYETTLRRVAEMGYTNVQLTPPAFSGVSAKPESYGQLYQKLKMKMKTGGSNGAAKREMTGSG